MKLSFLVGAAVGYVLGARAGRERYETIVAWGRKIGGSQTVQSTAGVLRAQVDTVKSQALQTVAARLRGAPAGGGASTGRANGHRG
jgi:hypothetical protein